MLLVRRLGGAATSQFRDGKSGGKSAASAAEQLPKRPPTPQSLWPSIEAPQSLSSAKTAVVSLMLFAAASDSLKFPTSGVAQWLACWAHSPKVRGSKPRSAIPMFPWPGGRAPGLQPQGRRFEPQWGRRRPRKKQTKPQNTHSTPPKSTESGQRAPKERPKRPRDTQKSRIGFSGQC